MPTLSEISIISSSARSELTAYVCHYGILSLPLCRREIRKGIFLTSHFMDEVEALCDEICILKKGAPVFRGTVEQAKMQCGCERFEDAYLLLTEEDTDK